MTTHFAGRLAPTDLVSVEGVILHYNAVLTDLNPTELGSVEP